MSLTPRESQEVPWNAAQTAADLRAAGRILSDRKLKLAAKWCAEQWMGLLGEDDQVDYYGESDTIVDEEDTSSHFFYAQTLMDLGEYAHAASVLSLPSQDVPMIHEPLPQLSQKAIYLRAYALYMAGERRKEEKMAEEGDKVKITNPYLEQLANELLMAYQNNQLDAFGLYVYGMVLSNQEGIVVPPQSPGAHVVLIESILQFPYNWSAWLDLAELAQNKEVEAAIETHVQPQLATHYMYHFFCAHLQTNHQEFDAALTIYERWMDPALFGQSAYLLTQFAILQYHLRSFAAASRALEEIRIRMPYRLDSMDIYSNILYVQENAVALAQLAHAATQVDKYRPETCCIVGNYYSLKQQRAKAIQYFQRALKIDKNFTSAWTLMGHEYVEWKQTSNAMEAYRKAVEVSPTDYRAWYGLGQTYEFLSMYLYALYYYKQAVALRPYDARMWNAMGTTLLHLGKTDDAIRSYERAVSLDDMEGISTQKLAPLYDSRGEKEKAAQCYMRYLELRYHVTHPSDTTVSNMATLSLDTMLQNLVVESNEAEALIYLANYHRAAKEFDTASLFCSRLLEYPGPEKEMAKAMLREIKTRQSTRIHTRSMGPVGPKDDGFSFSP